MPLIQHNVGESRKVFNEASCKQRRGLFELILIVCLIKRLEIGLFVNVFRGTRGRGRARFGSRLFKHLQINVYCFRAIIILILITDTTRNGLGYSSWFVLNVLKFKNVYYLYSRTSKKLTLDHN